MALVAAAAAALSRRALRQQAAAAGLARAVAQACASAEGGALASLPPFSASSSGTLAWPPSWLPTGQLHQRPLHHPLAPQPQQQQQQRGYAVARSAPGRHRGRGRQQPQPELPNLPARNRQIKAEQLRVVFPEEESKPTTVLALADALQEAAQRGLDLVMVSAQADPPVARLVSWDKVVYQAQKREKEAKRQQRAAAQLTQPKEVRIGCHIAEHDLDVKLSQARGFLGDGYPLRLVVTFTGGREIALGAEMAQYLVGKLGDVATVQNPDWRRRAQRNQWVVPLVSLAKKGVPAVR